MTTTILALDLGTTTGWALRGSDGHITSGSESFRPQRFEGGGMRFLRFKRWLTEIKQSCDGIDCLHFEEVRRHVSTDAAHAYGGFLATLTAWCEHHQIPYQGVPVGTIKKHATGKGNASKDDMVAAARGRGHHRRSVAVVCFGGVEPCRSGLRDRTGFGGRSGQGSTRGRDLPAWLPVAIAVAVAAVTALVRLGR